MTAASPKTDELVEKIARAINDSLIRQYVKSKRWEGAPDVIVGFDETAAARACLAEIEAAGMVVVPREPTEEMEEAGGNAFAIGDLRLPDEVWGAMIAAAPKQG